jgi:hypothetical protein
MKNQMKRKQLVHHAGARWEMLASGEIVCSAMSDANTMIDSWPQRVKLVAVVVN